MYVARRLFVGGCVGFNAYVLPQSDAMGTDDKYDMQTKEQFCNRDTSCCTFFASLGMMKMMEVEDWASNIWGTSYVQVMVVEIGEEKSMDKDVACIAVSKREQDKWEYEPTFAFI